MDCRVVAPLYHDFAQNLQGEIIIFAGSEKAHPNLAMRPFRLLLNLGHYMIARNSTGHTMQSNDEQPDLFVQAGWVSQWVNLRRIAAWFNERPFERFAVLVILHIALAPMLYLSPFVPAVHALVMIGIGIVAALRGSRRGVGAVAAYIAGAEVLWRATGVPNILIYELAKYAIVLILSISFVRLRLRLRVLPILFMAVLIPGAVLALLHGDELRYALGQISFNLSGLLLLAAAVLYFSNLTLNRDDLIAFFQSLMLPATMLAALALRSILTAPAGFWAARGVGSNFTASAGYGPNQVSSTLALAVFAAGLLLMLWRLKFWQRLLIGLLGGWLLLQCLLTLSRGGIYTTGAAVIASLLPLIFKMKVSRKTVLIGGGLVMASVLAVVMLNALTQGIFVQRFASLSTTDRDKLAGVDLALFAQHPMLGVGVGVAKLFRPPQVGVLVPAHTEYTRLLSEHGLFGAAALVMLAFMTYQNIRHARRDTLALSVVLGCLAWALFYMLHSATRIAAPMLLFGLTSATFAPLFSEDVEQNRTGRAAMNS